MPSLSKLEILQEWFKEHQVKYEKSLIEITANLQESAGYGIIAKQNLDVGTIVCQISKEAILSVRNCGIADLLEENELTGPLGLTIALMYERSLGQASPWAGYLQSLPEKEFLPMFWSPSLRNELIGTNLGDILEQDIAFLQEDYETHVVSLLKEHPDIFDQAKMTLDDFLAATSLVTSRAFQVDMYHEDSMVPLADM